MIPACVRTVLLPVIALGVLMATGCADGTPSQSASDAVEQGGRAPDFTLHGSTGEISLADYRGERPVLLYFSMGPG